MELSLENGLLALKNGLASCECCAPPCACDPNYSEYCWTYFFTDDGVTYDGPICVTLSGALCDSSFSGGDGIANWILEWDTGAGSTGQWVITSDYTNGDPDEESNAGSPSEDFCQPTGYYVYDFDILAPEPWYGIISLGECCSCCGDTDYDFGSTAQQGFIDFRTTSSPTPDTQNPDLWSGNADNTTRTITFDTCGLDFLAINTDWTNGTGRVEVYIDGEVTPSYTAVPPDFGIDANGLGGNCINEFEIRIIPSGSGQQPVIDIDEAGFSIDVAAP